MTVSIWQANGEQVTQNADIVVIGAGLLGCTAAYYLKQAGHDATLIDAQDVGLGASSRNAGFMLTGLDQYYHRAEERYGMDAAREIWTLSQRTRAFWHQIGAQFGVTMDQTGSLLLAESAQEAEDLQQAARRMSAQGFDCEYLSDDPLERGYFGAIRQPGDGGLHPYQLVHAIFKASGAELIANSEVYAIEPDGAEVIVYSQKAIVRARKVLICTNAYTVHLDNFFRDKIVPVRAQCLATAPLPEPIINAVGYSDYGYMYYRDLPDGGLLVGGARRNFQVQENDTTDDRITDPVQRALTHYLRTKFPDVDAPVVRCWAGIMAFTSDGLPLVGSLPRDGRIVFAVGLNGHGLSLGAAVAERAVEKILNGTGAGVFDTARLME